MGKVTFINAIITGKLAGTVYARNKAGYYIRNFTTPLNPRTAAQLGARGSFNAASSAWHALTDLQKAAWNSYSLTNFTPKGGVSGSPVSGFNAFVSLYNAASNGNRLARAYSISTPAGASAAGADYVPVLDAPVKELSQMIKDSSGNPLPLTLGDITLAADTADMTVEMTFPTSQLAAPVFEDAVGDIPVGFSLQVSKALTQSQQFVGNPHITTVAQIRPTGTISSWSASSSIVFTLNSDDFPIPDHKLWFTTGDKAQVNVYVVGQNGAMKSLGAKIIEIT